MEDKYNFNRGQVDIATGLPDNENGAFEVLGWAKSFMSKGETTFEFSWRKGETFNQIPSLNQDTSFSRFRTN